MEPTTFNLEYDFRTISAELINPKTQQLKKKYRCLPYMITLDLTQPLNPISEPNQPIPEFHMTTLTSTSSTNGWLNFTIVQNQQPNIITVRDNTLFINYYPYNYDITVNVNRVGVDNVDLRFMAINPFTDPPRATNMNDIFGAETSYSNIKTGQTIKFTVTGQYQYFFINYPSMNFDLNIMIEKSNNMTPVFICDIMNKNCNSCRCFEIDGRGYIKIKKKDKHVDVPVYVIQDTQNSRNKYLYPEFGYLRDLFFNITVANSLMPPGHLFEAKPPTTITCGVIPATFWIYYVGPLDTDLITVSPSLVGGFFDQIEQKFIGPDNEFYYRYSWNTTESLVQTIEDFQINPPTFAAYVWRSGRWDGTQFLALTPVPITDPPRTNYTLSAGSFDNLSGYEWVAFGITGTQELDTNDTHTFTINVQKLRRS